MPDTNTESREYKNVEFPYNVAVEVVLRFDEPITRPSKFGGNFYIFGVVDGDGENASFLVSETAKGESFKSFRENLGQFKAGDKLEITKTEKVAKNGRNFALYSVKKLGEETLPTSAYSPKNAHLIKPEKIKLDETEKEIVNIILDSTAEYRKRGRQDKVIKYKSQIIHQFVRNGISDERARLIFAQYIEESKD